MFWNGSTAMDGLSGSVSGTSSACDEATGDAAAGAAIFQSAASHFTPKACTGRSIFLSARLPKSVNVALSRPTTAS